MSLTQFWLPTPMAESVFQGICLFLRLSLRYEVATTNARGRMSLESWGEKQVLVRNLSVWICWGTKPDSAEEPSLILHD